MEPRKIALDTNMLLTITEHKVRITEQIKQEHPNATITIPQQVKEELEKLATQNTKKRKAVQIAQKIIQNEQIKTTKIEAQNADKALLKLSQKGYIIATNDKKLAKQIQEQKGKIIYLRQKKMLEEK
jgi:rRNA-processing protein FCF1